MLGPTAAGKSEVALRLAEEIGGELISVDSMQVYCRMDIGTAKPTAADRERVPHHGIDLVDPAQEFSVADFQTHARSVLEHSDGPVVIAGGSGLHFRAVVDPLQFRPHDDEVRALVEQLSDEEARSRLLEIDPSAVDYLDINNPRRVIRALEVARLTGETPTARSATSEYQDLSAYRPLFPFRAVALDAGESQSDRVEQRLASMVAAGLLDEVAGLADNLGRTARQAVGYKELLPVIAGEMTIEAGIEEARLATMRLVKRQRTYFRRDPRLTWLAWSEDPEERYRAACAALRSRG